MMLFNIILSNPTKKVVLPYVESPNLLTTLRGTNFGFLPRRTVIYSLEIPGSTLLCGADSVSQSAKTEGLGIDFEHLAHPFSVLSLSIIVLDPPGSYGSKFVLKAKRQ